MANQATFVRSDLSRVYLMSYILTCSLHSLKGNKMISGARGYENCLSHNTVVTVFFLEHVFACFHGVSPTYMQTYL